jgi:signal transduction histidine kinase/DNA-binding response OmpR family regulator
MKSQKTLKLPFYFITALTLGLIGIILFTRSQADKSINQLQKGNKEAIRVFKANQLLDEIINGLFIVETNLQEGKKEQAGTITDTLNAIGAKSITLQSLFKDKEIESSTNQFNSLVQKQLVQLQIELFKKNISSAPEAPKPAQQLTDTIFISAIALEEKMGTYLQKNITGNEILAVRVLRLDLTLTLIIITTISVLATIIIGYLLRNLRLIQAVQKQRMEIEKAANIKEQFLANMSHEIRTPINSVIGFTNLLQKTEMDQKQSTFVNMIQSAGENLLTIVNDILDISKIEAGMLHFDKSPFSITEVCYHAETLLYQKANDKKLNVTTHIDPSVPEVVMGDKERLIQILTNLTSNAIKFTERGGVTISVTTTEKTDNSVSILFSVKDSGIGISSDKLGTIFQRFEQAEADTTRKYGGTGLGLSIVKSLVEMQGGSISVRSAEGVGSEFFVNLTYEIKDNVMVDYLTSYNKNTVPVINNKNNQLMGVKILAAEDNKMNQMLLRMLFEQWNMNIDIAENGDIAVEKLKKEKYAMVLMDIQMPVMDGFTATRKIRNELKENIPIIAMTANVLPGEKDKCFEVGMTGYISKPINESELYSLLQMHSNRSTTANGIQTENMQQHSNEFVSDKYLSRVFNNNRTFVNEITKQFVKQYQEELLTLKQHITAKDMKAVNKMGHHMKTTVSSVNNESPLVPSLEAIENANDSETGWNIVNYNYDFLSKTKTEVLVQAQLLMQGTESVDLIS